MKNIIRIKKENGMITGLPEWTGHCGGEIDLLRVVHANGRGPRKCKRKYCSDYFYTWDERGDDISAGDILFAAHKTDYNYPWPSKKAWYGVVAETEEEFVLVRASSRERAARYLAEAQQAESGGEE